ncbi:MAG: carboxypeptidase regulatory-like domain-containing protein [Spirochaetes bacterium]|nr:carboxypeptidase regulatory-like domain-containing protein [Spirochaetota bacterium]
MNKVFIFDISKCCGCYNCQLACKDEHVENDWTPYAKPQPEAGQFWIKIQENVCGTIPKVKMHYIPMLCNHCENAVCMEACPEKAITRREDGLILIEPDKCKGANGCKACITACPYNAVYFNESLGLAQKCTGCAHLLDNGNKLPRCVEVCPTDAITFGEKEKLKEQIKDTVVLQPDSGCSPNVYYKNIPGKFIAGTVYDPVEKEVIIGAKCILYSKGKSVETFTDSYGDFWFNDLEAGTYDVTIQAQGFAKKNFTGLNTAKDINLGDIPLEK